MVRVDIICGYLVSPKQLRLFANAQGIRYDPGGDLALIHSQAVVAIPTMHSKYQSPGIGEDKLR